MLEKSYLNIAGYLFTNLTNLVALQTQLHSLCAEFFLKGTILLSTEGMNINLAGETPQILAWRKKVAQEIQVIAINEIQFHETYSHALPFKKLKIKIKEEIITFRQKNIHPEQKQANNISPQVLKNWLDENKDFTLLDTRNNFEIALGTFHQAENLSLSHFSEFADKSAELNLSKPIVLFCTGGIRCEKAALYLQQQNPQAEIYQLAGGILGYFKEVGGQHYQGNCFVFDDRLTVNPELQEASAH